MSNLYLDAYDAAVLRHWGELLKRHGRQLRRPPARGWVMRTGVDGDGDDDGDQHVVIPSLSRDDLS